MPIDARDRETQEERRRDIGLPIAKGKPMASEQDAYHELCAYTLLHGDPSFIHQHVVDAFAAQHATDETKPMGLTFALVGLFLHVEHKFSGKQVQRVHMQLARQKRSWPAFALPRERGAMSAVDVMAFPPGPERDRAIDAWCASVWEAFRDSHGIIAQLLREHGIGG
jgi:hypothetical protein